MTVLATTATDVAAEEHDVLVVGGGPAGLMAAIEAAQAGARTLLLECEAILGGSGAISAGHTVFCETDLCDGTRDELRQDLEEAHDGVHTPELVSLYVDEAAATYRRVRQLGLPFARTVQLAHMSRPWVHEAETGGGAALVSALERAARSAEVKIVTNFRMRSLLHDASGRVTGLSGTRGDTPTDMRGKAVVLACGGFTRNKELLKTFGTEKAQRILPLTGQGSRGDGHLAAMALGAATSYMTMGILPTGPVDPMTDRATLIFYCGGIVLNTRGERFYPESAGYTELSNAALDQPGSVMVHIYDATAAAQYASTQWASVEALSGWSAIRADTLDALFAELGERSGLDAERAADTVAKYNNDVLSEGFDTVLGRRHLVGDAGALTPIETGPFYAAITQPGTTNFNGGLTIDAETRVRDVFDEPIDRLYAAGEIAGGFHGAGYMSGTQWGQALIFGRCAGLAASAAALRDPRGVQPTVAQAFTSQSPSPILR